jgi:Flp pilus assembly protein TadD
VPPLVAYRAAICDGVARNTLERLRTAVPRFIDTNFFLARLDVVRAIAVSGSSTNVAINIDVGSGNNQAHALLAEARERFPDSASLAYLSAAANQLDGDCGAALEFYDRTLALKSLHEDALLGRTTCLTYLKRPDEAIAGATRMIDLRTDNWGEAYYWRAWNLAARHDLDAARADIERAKTLAAGGQTFTLAGIIEHDQDALAIAESDLKRATMLDRQGKNCTAMWYLALVKLKQELRLESAGQFENSMICYDRHVQDDEQGLRTMQARTDLDPVFRARRIAGFETALKEDRSQYYAAAFNAANQSAHGGNLDKARVLIEIAAKDPAIGDKVAELREIIK